MRLSSNDLPSSRDTSDHRDVAMRTFSRPAVPQSFLSMEKFRRGIPEPRSAMECRKIIPLSVGFEEKLELGRNEEREKETSVVDGLLAFNVSFERL